MELAPHFFKRFADFTRNSVSVYLDISLKFWENKFQEIVMKPTTLQPTTHECKNTISGSLSRNPRVNNAVNSLYISVWTRKVGCKLGQCELYWLRNHNCWIVSSLSNLDLQFSVDCIVPFYIYIIILWLESQHLSFIITRI